MFKCSWEVLFFESEETEIFKADRNKLFASNEKQIDNHTLILDMLCSNMSVVCTYHCRDAFKKIFWCGCCSLLIFVAKKPTKGTELQFLCTIGILRGGWVEDHEMMLNTRHLHLPQLYIQAMLYIYKTDYMTSLTLYTLPSVCIFSIPFSIHFLMHWQGEVFNNQEVLQLNIISFILMTLMLDSGMIL